MSLYRYRNSERPGTLECRIDLSLLFETKPERDKFESKGDGDVVNFLTLWLWEETESQGGGFRLINAGRACIFEVRKPVRRIWPMNSVRFGRGVEEVQNGRG